MLCNTSSRPDDRRTPNCIYKIFCTDCPDFYIGQTYRPISLRIKEHEAAYRLNNIYDSATRNIKSAPAKHAHDNQHHVDFNSIQILSTVSNRHCLNLLEHAAIVTLDPPLNRQHAGPRINTCWQALLPTITRSFNKPITVTNLVNWPSPLSPSPITHIYIHPSPSFFSADDECKKHLKATDVLY